MVLEILKTLHELLALKQLQLMFCLSSSGPLELHSAKSAFPKEVFFSGEVRVPEMLTL